MLTQLIFSALTLLSLTLPTPAQDHTETFPDYTHRVDHNYLQEAYNTKPYEHMSDEDVLKDKRTYRASFDIPQEDDLAVTCFVDDDWRERCDFLQYVYQKGTEENGRKLHLALDDNLQFTYSDLDQTIHPDYRDQYHPKGRFYYMKKVAWIDAVMAKELSGLLTSGVDPLIPQNNDWSVFWHRRANVLESQDYWHIPY